MYKKRRKYNKLVRDKIPEYIKSRGKIPVIHIASDKEYWRKLKEKLLEEGREFLRSEEIEEVADIEETIDAICQYKKFSRKDILAIKKKKASERGKFKKRIILEEA